MQRYRIVFSKGDETRFLSHLDLLAMWEYSVRLARLPIELALGFNPRPIISLASPLPTGYLGEAEIVEISLTASIPCQEVHGRLRASLPAGITISGVEAVPDSVKSAASRVVGASYRVELLEPVVDLSDRVRSLLAEPTMEVREERHGKMRIRDLAPLIQALDAPAPNRVCLRVGLTEAARPGQSRSCYFLA